jgi:hypothetical protein
MARLIAAAGHYPRVVVVVHGAARGTDKLAERAARAFGMATEAHAADWEAHGKRAGFIRNAEMVALGADLVLAFYKQGAGNKGTGHCAKLAEKAGIPVRRVTDDPSTSCDASATLVVPDPPREADDDRS